MPPAGITQVCTGISVPTVGADALLYILRYAAATPVFDATILYIVPTDVFTDVAFVVAAEVSADSVGVISVVSVVFAVTVGLFSTRVGTASDAAGVYVAASIACLEKVLIVPE